jgi:DDE_Tnp_1-associated
MVPDPRRRAGRWHPLDFVLALAVCAFTSAGHDSPTAITGWARNCTRETLFLLGARPDPLTGRVWPPSTRTFRRVFQKIDADALNCVLYGFLDAMPASAPEELPEVTRHEREQRRAAAAIKDAGYPHVPEGRRDHTTHRSPPPPRPRLGQKQTFTKHAGALRCHRKTVPGVTSRCARRLMGRCWIKAASTARSAQSSRGRGWVRRSTATSCRSTSSSAFLDADDRVSRTSHPHSRTKIR